MKKKWYEQEYGAQELKEQFEELKDFSDNVVRYLLHPSIMEFYRRAPAEVTDRVITGVRDFVDRAVFVIDGKMVSCVFHDNVVACSHNYNLKFEGHEEPVKKTVAYFNGTLKTVGLEMLIEAAKTQLEKRVGYNYRPEVSRGWSREEEEQARRLYRLDGDYVSLMTKRREEQKSQW